MNKDGPSLSLWNENSRVRTNLQLFIEGPYLSLIDENGEARNILAALKHGSGLVLYDEKGVGRTMIVLGKEKEDHALKLLDENGKVIWSAIK